MIVINTTYIATITMNIIITNDGFEVWEFDVTY